VKNDKGKNAKDIEKGGRKAVYRDQRFWGRVSTGKGVTINLGGGVQDGKRGRENIRRSSRDDRQKVNCLQGKNFARGDKLSTKKTVFILHTKGGDNGE